MTGAERSEYQEGIFGRYYDNRDAIMLEKLGELVTELYLAETDAKRERLWKRAEKAMSNLKVQPSIIEHIIIKRDPEILAKNLQDWLDKSTRR